MGNFNISNITKKKIFNLLTSETNEPSGDLVLIDFLKRIYNLEQLPSYDNRFPNMEKEIIQHTINNDDWDSNWYLDDERLNVKTGDDGILLNLLVESINPEVRIDKNKVDTLLTKYNEILAPDGYEIIPNSSISGHQIFTYKKIEKKILNHKQPTEKNINEDLSTIWGPNFNDSYKLFISHVHEIQNDCSSLKDFLQKYGILCFVAHVDIKVNEEWQQTIEVALKSCDGLLAIVNDEFFKRVWTNQEVGIAFGREIDIFTILIDENKPEGFIGKYQAIKLKQGLADSITILAGSSNIYDIFKKIIQYMPKTDVFDELNFVYDVLNKRASLNEEEVELIIKVFNDNPELYRSNKFGGKQGIYKIEKTGLANLLNKKTGKDYNDRLILN